jgi:N-acetylneuraminic acid mutarotase
MTRWLTGLYLLCLPMMAADALWKSLPSLPDAEGFAGAFAGVADGALLVAGGTNFPDKKPWEGGTKLWYDKVYALQEPSGKWQIAGRLPKPNGYGVSLTTESGLICIGGGDASANFREVIRIRFKDGKLMTEPLPALPRACALMAGAKLGQIIYIAGGIEKPADTVALTNFLALDLERLNEGWKPLPACPGSARILPTMAAVDGAVYLFSGAALKPGPDGKAAREWLKDAWRYSPEAGWKRLSDLPRVSVAAPSPAPVRGGRMLLMGGDDGALVHFEPKDRHPGFPREVLAYDWKQDVWARDGEVPFSLVTTPAVEWHGAIVIPGGEARPGKRSPEVWWRTY